MCNFVARKHLCNKEQLASKQKVDVASQASIPSKNYSFSSAKDTFL